MSSTRIPVNVKDGMSTYTAMLHKHRASSTASAEQAVRRVAQKYVDGSGMKLLRAPLRLSAPEPGREVWSIEIGDEASFDINTQERTLIAKIIERAEKAGITKKADRQTHKMDLAACHANGCPLQLERMLAWERDFDLAHDIWGIHGHIDRDTGTLRNCFLPRFAVPASDKTRTGFIDRGTPGVIRHRIAG